jgi:signal transduction histidine kinase
MGSPVPESAAPTPWHRRFGWLRYLALVPLYNAYRRRTERDLRWRLATSHVLAVVLSVAIIGLIGAAILVGVALYRSPTATEPARDARAAARIVEQSATELTLETAESSGMLAAISAGLVQPSAGSGLLRVGLDFPGHFRAISSVSLVDSNLLIVSSSDPALIGASVSRLDSGATTTSVRALAGITDPGQLSVVRDNPRIVAGAYPLRDPQGRTIGAVLVIKTQTTLPGGLALVRLVGSLIAQLGLTLAIFAAIPALPVGFVAGVRRARDISEPVTTLAAAAGRMADGDLAARVEITGDDEIGQLEREFNAMADRLEQALAEETRLRSRAEDLLGANRSLVSNISHELRTPVAIVRGHLEAALDDPDFTDDALRISLREADRLERLVDDLFQLSRLESKRLDIDHATIDAAAIAREAAESLTEPARRDADITILCNAPRDPLLAIGDRPRLVQVLQNLLRNAIRHTPEGGLIMVEASAADGRVLLRVADTGEGIAPEHLPHVFERFYRADAARERSAGGAGLGLAIARELVDAMGGEIAVTSAPGEGAAFTITLPAAIPGPAGRP